jgi:F0F1-type ATP synthase membrane subunit c/vacuolar-type H+-ATPase subunit K
MTESGVQPRRLVATIVHGSLLASVAMYWVVLEIAAPPPRADFQSALLYALAGMAVLDALFAWQIDRVLPSLADKIRSGDEGATFVRNIIRWALCEAIAIFGLALAFMGAPRAPVLGFFGVAVALMVAFSPWGASPPRRPS